MNKSLLRLLLLIALSVATNSAFAASIYAPGQNKLTCFDGPSEGTIYGGDCLLKSNGARGPAVLDNSDADLDGSYSGVYIDNSSLYGNFLSDVSALSFNYSGEASPGSPRISLPVDIDANGTTDGYLFISAYYCNDGAGLVDVIQDSTCSISTNFSIESWTNWNDLISSHPNWQVATDSYAFIIADDPGTWTLTGVKLGSVK